MFEVYVPYGEPGLESLLCFPTRLLLMCIVGAVKVDSNTRNLAIQVGVLDRCLPLVLACSIINYSRYMQSDPVDRFLSLSQCLANNNLEILSLKIKYIKQCSQIFKFFFLHNNLLKHTFKIKESRPFLIILGNIVPSDKHEVWFNKQKSAFLMYRKTILYLKHPLENLKNSR